MTIKKKYFTWADVEGQVINIARQITNSDWKPDYIVGITRGGLVPATLLSQWFNVPCETLKISLRDHESTESNTWMAEDAFGYVPLEKREETTNPPTYLPYTSNSMKNILIVDDINDSGATFNWLMNDWRSSCLSHDSHWEDVWNGNVRFAVLADNLASQCSVGMDYFGIEIDKNVEELWLVFPWEDWWIKNNQ